jgi:hypothetical protein
MLGYLASMAASGGGPSGTASLGASAESIDLVSAMSPSLQVRLLPQAYHKAA